MTRKSSKRSTNKPKRSAKEYIKFVLIAVVLMFIADTFLWGGERPYVKKFKEQYYKEKQAEQEAIESFLPPVVVYPEDGSEYFEEKPETKIDEQSMLPEKQLKMTKVMPEALSKVVKKAETKPKKFAGQKAKIAIVIDDVGMNITQSNKAINLPPEVTLAFLPYARAVRDLSAKARSKGHEIIIHTPMEAVSSGVSLGSMALRSDMDFASFDAEFDKIANSFEGYVGVNNHMGSRLTQDREAMGYLMDQLKQRGLYFLDSRTIGTSVAADTAEAYGVPHARRDVFLDHEETSEFTAAALKKLEQTARRQGYAIAIGHPKKITMDALKNWIPTLNRKGFELVPLSEVLEKPDPDYKLVTDIKNIAQIEPAAGDNYGVPPIDFYLPAIDVMNSAPVQLRSRPLE